MFNWNDLKFVLAISRSGTLSQAASQLNVDQTTVTRRLKLLERQFGAGLFERHQNRLVATDAGEKVVQVAEQTEAHAIATVEQLSGADMKCEGRLRLTAVPLLMNQLIAGRIGDLLRLHPGLSIELIATPHNLEFSKRQADIAIRFNRPTKGIAVCRKLTDLSYSVYCKARMNPDALPFIGYSEARQALPQAIWLNKRPNSLPASQLLVDDAQTALSAVLAGSGRALLPDRIMQDSAAVQRDVNYSRVFKRELWLLLHPDMRQLKRIKVVSEWIVKLFKM